MQFEDARRRVPALVDVRAIGERGNAESAGEVITPIQGIMPASKEEWRVGMALMKLKLSFQFQVSVNGGRSRRGGQVVDFVVYGPFPTPVQVDGEYWHSGQLRPDERMMRAQLEQVYQREVVVIWGSEATSVQAAVQVLRRYF